MASVPVPLHKVGPALLLVAQDPTVALGAGWKFLGPTRGQTVFNPGLQVSTGGNDLVGTTPVAGSTYVVGFEATLTCQLLDETKATLKAYLANALVASAGGLAVGLAAGLQKFSEPWLVVVPWDEAAQGIAAPNAIWIPAAIPTDVGQFTRELPQAGQANERPRQTVFRAAYRTHVKSGGQELPQGANIAFIGPPAQWTINTVVLPDLTQYVPSVVAAA